MKLYLDQMFRLDLATLLRAEGHDVLCAFEAGQATADDTQILQLAINQGRVLITMDEHFGHWAILPPASGFRHPEDAVRLTVAVAKEAFGTAESRAVKEGWKAVGL